MTRFNLDVVADEAARTPWEFELGGRVWRVPHIADLTLEQQEKADQGRPDLAVTDALVWDDGAEATDDEPAREAGWVPAGKQCAAAIRSLRGAKRGALLVAWLAHAGMQPGESPASSSS